MNNIRISKTTSKGQITLPIEFRKMQETNTYMVSYNSQQVTITPYVIEKNQNDGHVAYGITTNILSENWESKEDAIWDVYDQL